MSLCLLFFYQNEYHVSHETMMEKNNMLNMYNVLNPLSRTFFACAACFAVFGCGGDSSSSSATSPQEDVCSVSKTSNSVTVKQSVEGVSSTMIYMFDANGDMVSITTVSDFSAMEDDATAKAVCDASGSVDGFKASYENGKCTIIQTVGLAGSLEDIYAAQNAVCDAENEGVKLSSSSVGDSPIESSSSSLPTDVAKLSDLKEIDCDNNILGYRIFVTTENLVYICASYKATSGTYTTWYPVIDDIKNAPKCTEELILSGEKSSYYAEKDNSIYGCVLDIKDPYDFSSAEYVWKISGVAETDNGKVSSSSVNSGAGVSSSSSINSESGISSSANSGIVVSSSSSLASSSASTEKVVTFKDGIIWEPSYASRVRTFFNTVDEYNFLDSNKVTGDSSGWWFKYLDSGDDGASTAIGVFSSSNLDLSITLKYTGWHLEYDGEYYYNAPDPYPYAGFGFNWSPDGEGASVDLSDWTGICITYQSSKSFEIAFPAIGDGDFAYYYPAVSSSTPKTIDIPFSSLTRSKYATTSLTRSSALTKVTAMHIKYTNDETKVNCNYQYYTPSECGSIYNSYSNSIQIYRIGKYGSCNDSGTIL